MKVAILLNRNYASYRSIGKNILNMGYQMVKGRFANLTGVVLPEYDSFAKILDSNPFYMGTERDVDWEALRGYDLLIWEWGWTETPPRTLITIRKNLDIPTLAFTGALDRFWRELNYDCLGLHLEAVQYTDMVGVILKDTIPFYKSVCPDAHVFHMPVPVDVNNFYSYSLSPEMKDHKTVLLTAPTQFQGISSQLPITTYLAFKDVLSRKNDLNGICFTYYGKDEEARARGVFQSLGISERIEIQPFLRPIFRYFEKVNPCYIGINLSHSLIQARIALISACLGIPMVVSDDIETHTLLYPFTTVKWYDTARAADLCLRLLEDREFYNKVCTEALERVNYYNIDNCRKRMLEGIELGLSLRGKREVHP